MDRVLDHIKDALVAPYSDFMTLQIPLSACYILSAILIAAVAYGARGAGLLKKIFPREVMLHPSALFDYQYYIVSRIFIVLFLGAFYFPGIWVNNAVVAGLTHLLGPPVAAVRPGRGLMIAETIAYIFAFDLGYWVRHWMMHRVPLLWEFHKGHHAAEALTPFTTLRTHPVDEFTSGAFVSACTGMVHGVFLYFNGPGASDIQLWQVNTIMLAFYIAFFNLRHSHVWISFGGPVGHVIQSPAHHQIHHSNEPRHRDKNFGFCLAFWDWIFGTLHVPQKDEKFTLGIGKESARYHSLGPFLLLPFANVAGKFRKADVSASTKPR
jgi:sterol desaturase/sphingolipid hydroxylase (fatty acid hydroxylase superfamily)